MATGTNGIATKTDCNNLINYSFLSDSVLCPTKKEIDACTGLSTPSSYSSNQLVKYADITKNTSKTVTVTITEHIGGYTYLDSVRTYSIDASGNHTSRGEVTKMSGQDGTYTATFNITTPTGKNTDYLRIYCGTLGRNRTIKYKDDAYQTTWTSKYGLTATFNFPNIPYSKWWNIVKNIYIDIS